MTAPTTLPTAAEVKDEARRIGFVACGIADLTPSRRGDALDHWLAQGYGGTMRYLHRQARKRKFPANVTPGATRAIVVLENYTAPRNELPASGDQFKIARYARGMDYHLVTHGRLHRLAEWLKGRGAGLAHVWLDDGPVPERELGERAGLGWIGKNTMLIHPRIGSWTFVGTVFTDVELEIDTPIDTDRCGSCTRCLDACPTDAFVADRSLDATRCLSYLTIEYKKPLPESLLPHWDGWAFGCDVCNSVCPWNGRFAVATTVTEFTNRRDPDRTDPAVFDTMSNTEFQQRYGDTPLARSGLERMRRNLRAATTARDPTTEG